MPPFLVHEIDGIPSYDIIKNDGKTQKKIKITVYNDDTVIDVCNKIAVEENLDYKYIFAWFQDTDKKVIPFSFVPDFSLKDPYSLFQKDEYETKFIDKEGTRISSSLESLYQNLVQNVSLKNEIHYCTIFDYLKYCKIDPKLDDDKIRETLKIDPKLFFLGNLQLYWKDLTNNDIIGVKDSKYQKRFKEVRRLIKKNSDIVGQFHKDLGSKMVYNDDFHPITLMISNCNDQEFGLNIIKLFTDFHLTDLKNHEFVFSKLYLDDNYNSYYKIRKDKVSLRKDDINIMNQDRFIRWTKGIATSIPNVSTNYVNFRNTLSYKIIDKNKNYFTLLIRESGSIECIFERTGEKVLTREFINDKIKFVNTFVDTIINKEKIYHNYELGAIPQIKTDLYGLGDTGVSLLSGHLFYDIKDYRKDILEYALNNLLPYTRFNRSVDNWIHGTYKRVNNYESIDTKLMVISKFAQEHNDKKDIISLIGEYFGLIEEDATDEYNDWLEMREAGNYKTENGVDFLIEGVKSSHIRISIGECSDYDEFKRIYQFFTILMSCYVQFIDKKKDIFGIFSKKKKDKEKVILEDTMQSIENEMISSELDGLDGLDDFIEESKESVKEESVIEESEVSEVLALDDMSSAESAESAESTQTSKSKSNSKSKNKSKSKSKSEESEESDEFSMGLLDDSSGSSGSSGSNSGGGFGREMVGGGYDIRSYYLNRMTKNPRYDNDLFDFETGKFQKSYKSGVQKYTYARSCSASLGRQPIAVTESELAKFKDNPEHGEGIGYTTAIKVPNREPINGEEIYYICPKYWDVKNECPKDPAKVDEFKDHVSGMNYLENDEGVPVKLTAKQKMNTEKYILIRNEGEYWNNAGDDINRYNIELTDNFHPEGYGLPCCNTPRLPNISKDEKVEIFIDVNGKKEWTEGTVKESRNDGKPTKKSPLKLYKIKVNDSGEIYEVPRKDVRKKKSTSYISNYVPCNIGQFCHVSQTIKSFIGQSKDAPNLNSGNYGLIRKGIKQNNRSYLTSMCYLIYESVKPANVDQFIKDILHDIQNHPIIYELGNGSFVNRFKSEMKDIPDEDIKEFLKFVKTKKIKSSYYERYLTKGDKTRFLKGPKNQASLLVHYYNEFSAIKNFERYLNDDKYMIDDTLITSLLISLSRMDETKTFSKWKMEEEKKKKKKKEKEDKGKGVKEKEWINKKLGIFVFEEIIDKVRINVPDGDINLDFDVCLLLFKKGTIYEPILFKYTENNHSFISKSIEDLVETNKISIVDRIKGFLLEKNVKKNETLKNLLSVEGLLGILKELSLGVTCLLYDDYNKIRYVQTEKNVFIPVKPSSLEMFNYKKVYQGSRMVEKNYPIYSDVIQVLKRVDSKINKDIYYHYLGDDTGVSTRGEWTQIDKTDQRRHIVSITELVVQNVSYIPVQKEEYSRKLHLDIISLNSLYESDKSILTKSVTKDDRDLFIELHEYKKSFTEALHRKLYTHMINHPELKEQILKIKDHDIKLDLHKKLEIYPLVKKVSKAYILITEKEFFSGCPLIEGEKIIYYKGTESEIDSVENILKYFTILVVNYSLEDFERFIKIETDVTKLNETMTDNEILFTHEQVLDEEHYDLFHSKSVYVSASNLYAEKITQKALSRIYRKKHTFKPVSFDKKYPKIVGEMIHKKSVLIKHQLLDLTNLDVILYSVNETFDKPTRQKLLHEMTQKISKNVTEKWSLNEKEMSVLELYEKYLGNKYDSVNGIIIDLLRDKHIITVPDLYLISSILKKSFVLISSLYSKMVSHDVFIVIHPLALDRVSNETEMFCFYQNKNYLANIMVGNLFNYPLDNLAGGFQKELKKQYRDLYDEINN